MPEDIETRVHRFVAEQVGVPAEELSAATTLFGDLGVDGDDAAELFSAFKKTFRVDLETLDLSRHFGPEGLLPSAPVHWLRQLLSRGTPEQRAGLVPITVGELVAAASAGSWPMRPA
jgi:acyl carrier protein